MNRRIRSKLLGFVASAMAPAAALTVALTAPAAFAAPAPAPAPPSIQNADCHLHAVLASKEEGGTQKELAFLGDKLKDDEFAAYKSFYEVELKKLGLKLAETGKSEFRSGHKVSLTLLNGSKKRLEMKFELSGRDGKTSLLSTRYGIDSGGVLMIRAGSDEFTHGKHKGKLFFAIQCVPGKS